MTTIEREVTTLVCECGGKREDHERTGSCVHLGITARRLVVGGLFIGTAYESVCPCREWRPKE